MSIIRLKEAKRKEEVIIESIKSGKIFVYPTDTIYGLGCDASDDKAVLKLRRIKRSKKPFSIIASKEWIKKNCYLGRFSPFLEKLPGPYTFILRLKKPAKKKLSKYVNLGKDTIGVRIPAHEFTKIILKARKPFITTSANKSGKKYAKSIQELPFRIRRRCILIDAGKIEGKPSIIIDLTGKIPKIIGR